MENVIKDRERERERERGNITAVGERRLRQSEKERREKARGDI